MAEPPVQQNIQNQLRQIEACVWEIPKQGGMRVPGRVYATSELMAAIRNDAALEQVVNVAHLPGIVGYSLAMPDIHKGTFAEEMPSAYKDVADVVNVVDRAGISKKVLKLKPMAVIKG